MSPESQTLISHGGTQALLRLFDLRTDGFDRLMNLMGPVMGRRVTVNANFPGLDRPIDVDLVDTDDRFFACRVRLTHSQPAPVIAVGQPGTDFLHEVADYYGRPADLVGIVGDTDIDWQTPTGISLRGVPITRAIFDCLEPREQFEVHVGLGVGSALYRFAPRLDAANRRLCGPLIVWVDFENDFESDVIVQRTLATWTHRAYFADGLTAEQLATYQCLRTDGLAPGAARLASKLVTA